MNDDHVGLAACTSCTLLSIGPQSSNLTLSVLWSFNVVIMRPRNSSINILRVMAQFLNFGNGGHFRLKRGFTRVDFG